MKNLFVWSLFWLPLRLSAQLDSLRRLPAATTQARAIYLFLKNNPSAPVDSLISLAQGGKVGRKIHPLG